MNGVIIDLDGTLANVGHRVHHVQKEIKDKKAFNSLMGEDGLNNWCFELLKAMGKQEYKLFL